MLVGCSHANALTDSQSQSQTSLDELRKELWTLYSEERGDRMFFERFIALTPTIPSIAKAPPDDEKNRWPSGAYLLRWGPKVEAFLLREGFGHPLERMKVGPLVYDLDRFFDWGLVIASVFINENRYEGLPQGVLVKKVVAEYIRENVNEQKFEALAHTEAAQKVALLHYLIGTVDAMMFNNLAIIHIGDASHIITYDHAFIDLLSTTRSPYFEANIGKPLGSGVLAMIETALTNIESRRSDFLSILSKLAALPSYEDPEALASEQNEPTLDERAQAFASRIHTKLMWIARHKTFPRSDEEVLNCQP